MGTKSTEKRILLVSHAPWSRTGYGAPIDDIAVQLINIGHKVFIMSVDSNRIYPGVARWVYPSTRRGVVITQVLTPPDRWGLGVIDAFCNMLQIDIILSFFDPWVLPEGYRVPGVEWWAWFPIDQTPFPPSLETSLEAAHRKYVFSQYGANLMPSANWMPLPVGSGYFDAEDKPKIEAKRMFGLQDGKTFLFSGANLPGDRKNLRNTVLGFNLYKQRGGEGRLIINTNLHGDFDLIGAINNIGAAEYILPVDTLTRLYALNKWNHAMLLRAADVLVHPSAAEGFGLVLAEAMATGTPVIAGRNTSQPEVVGIGSELGKGGILIEAVEAEVSPLGGVWHRPTIEGIADALTADLTHLDPACSALRFKAEEIGALWEAEF